MILKTISCCNEFIVVLFLKISKNSYFTFNIQITSHVIDRLWFGHLRRASWWNMTKSFTLLFIRISLTPIFKWNTGCILITYVFAFINIRLLKLTTKNFIMFKASSFMVKFVTLDFYFLCFGNTLIIRNWSKDSNRVNNTLWLGSITFN